MQDTVTTSVGPHWTAEQILSSLDAQVIPDRKHDIVRVLMHPDDYAALREKYPADANEPIPLGSVPVVVSVMAQKGKPIPVYRWMTDLVSEPVRWYA